MKESVRNRTMRFLCIAIFLSMLIAVIGVCVKNVSYANTASLFAASGGAVIAEDNQAWSNSVGGSAAVTYKQEVKGTQGVMIAGKDGDTAVYSETVDLWNKNAEEAVIKFLFPTTAGTEYAEPNFVVRFTSVADPNKYFSVFFVNRAQTNDYHVGVSTYYEKHMQSTSLADTTNTKQERIIYTGINYGNNGLGYVNNTGAVLGTGYGPNGEVPESIGNYRDESGTKMTNNDSPLGIYFEMTGGMNADGTARYDNTVYTNAGFTHLGYSPQVNIGTEESPLYRYTVQSLTHIYNAGMQSPALELSEEEASAMRLSITFMENAKGGTPTPTAQGRILVTEVMGKSMAASEDSFSYDMFNGVHVTSAQAGGTVTYDQAVRLNDNTALDKLVEFSIDPSTPKTSAAGAYSPDFEQLTVRMGSSSGKAVDIRVGKSDTKKTYTNSSFYDGELVCNNMIVTAAGGEQTLLTAGDGLLPQTFAAYSLGSNGHLYSQTSDAFIDENGTMVMDGNHTRFALYYDAWENALYTDFGRKNAENMRSFVDENNKTVYRWLIRDFDEALGEDTAVFEGFGEEDVTISIKVGAVAEGRTAAYTIYAIDGRSLAVDKNGEAVQTVKPVRAQESVVSCKGQTIPVPGLTVYNCHEGWIVDREQSAMYYVIVKDPEGRKIESASDVLWSEELAVTLDVTGTYTVEYYSDLLTEPFAETAIVAEEPEETEYDFDGAFVAGDGATVSSDSELTAKKNSTIGQGAYNGIRVTGSEGSTVTYTKTIDLNDISIDNEFFEFIVTPSVYAERATDTSTFTGDFRQMIVTLTDAHDPSSKVSIDLHPRVQDGSMTTMATAAATGQNFGGLYGLSAQDASVLAYGKAAVIPYTFDGYSNRSSAVDERGNAVANGNHGSIKLYYDKNTNAVYINYGHTEAPTFVEGRDAETQGYRWMVRDFDVAYGIRDKNSDPLQPINEAGAPWSGFVSDEVILSVTVYGVTEGRTASYTIISAGGDKMQNSIAFAAGESNAAVGVENVQYIYAEPYVWDGEKAIASGSDVYVKVTKGTETIVEMMPYASSGGFTPEEAGTYEVCYQYGKTMHVVGVTIYSRQDAKPVIVPNLETMPDEIFLNESLDIGGMATSVFDRDGKDITLTVSVMNGEDVLIDSLQIGTGETYRYAFESAGEYTVRLCATGQFGLQETLDRTVTVIRYSYRFADGITERYVWEDGAAAPVISAGDLLVSDAKDGEIPSGNITVEVKKEGGTFVPYDAQTYSFDEVTTYIFRYTCTYACKDGQQYTFSAEREIVLNYSQPVISATGTLAGAVANEAEENTETTHYFKALQGGTVSLSGMEFSASAKWFDLSKSLTGIKYSVAAPDGTVSEIGDPAEYSLQLSQIGIYRIMCEVVDPDTQYTGRYIFVIDVRAYWLQIETTADYPAGCELGSAIDLGKYIVTDITGAAVSDATVSIEVSFGGVAQTLTEQTFKPLEVGEYTAMYTVVKGAEKVQLQKTFYVSDTQKPTIVLQGEQPATGTVGQSMNLPLATVEDNSGAELAYTVSVYLNGEKTEIVADLFTPSQEGTYTVVYTATDEAGNTGELSYDIVVTNAEEGGCGGCGGSAGTGIAGYILAAVAVLAVCAVAVARKRKI